MMTIVPLKVFLAVFKDSLSVLAKALWIGIIELRVGISKPIPIASRVAFALGMHVTSP